MIKERLADSIFAGHPKIFHIMAPAGFGKSVFAERLGERFQRKAVCDCAQLRDATDFARRIIRAIDELSVSAADIAEQRLTLSTASVETCEAFLHDQWSHCHVQGLLIFENVEDLLPNMAEIDLLASLIAHPLSNAAIAICTRVDLPLQIADTYDPHEVTTITAEHLRFSYEEFASVFRSTSLSVRHLRAAYDATLGWPFASVQLFQLLKGSAGRNVVKALDAYEGAITDYMSRELIASLDDRTKASLVRCCALSHARIEEIAQTRSRAKARQIVASLQQSVPFLAKQDDETYEVHSLLRNYVLESYPTECALEVRNAADNAASRHDAVRAAELYLQLNEQDSAAAALAATANYLADSPSLRFAEALRRIDRSVLMKYPNLWALYTIIGHEEIQPLYVGEGEAIYEGMTNKTPISLRAPVVGVLCNCYSELGRLDDALRVIEDLEERVRRRSPVGNAATTVALLIETFKYSVCIELGREFDDIGVWKRFGTHIENAPTTHVSFLSAIEAHIAIYRGDRQQQKAIFERALQIAEMNALPRYRQYTLFNAFVWAWFANDQDAGRYLEGLRKSLDFTSPILRAFVRQLDGMPPEREPEFRYTVSAWGSLIGAFAADDEQSLKIRLREAVARADKAGGFAPRILARVALAQCDDDNRRAILAAAHGIAANIEFSRWREAVEAVQEGRDTGVLAALVQRCENKRRELASLINISVLRGTVTRGGKLVPLPRRELEILIFLALERRGRHRDEVLDALWPASDTLDANNALKVFINRVRQRFNDRYVVVAESGTYRLGDSVRVDLWVADRNGKSSESASVGLPELYKTWCWASELSDQLRLRQYQG